MGGTVYKRCTKCSKRPDRTHESHCPGRNFTWYFRADLPRGVDGKRQRLKRGGFDTKKAAERALRDVLGQVDHGEYVESTELGVAEFLVDEWLPTQEPPKVSPNRYRNIRNAVLRHLAPALGSLTLQDLKPVQLDQLYRSLLRGTELGAVGGRQALAPSTVLQIHGVIRKALRDAHKWGLVEHNVAETAEPPSNAAVQAARRRSIQIWTHKQLTQFLTRSRDNWLFPMWMLATTTGLRRGELAGIVDSSIDLAAGRLVVDWQLVPEEQLDGGGTVPVHKPVMKSSASSRSIDLDRHTIEVLEVWLCRRSIWAQELAWRSHGNASVAACDRGHGHTGHGHFLFCWPDGRHLNPDWISHEFTRMCRDADVPTIRLHDVRHTHASLMLADGEHLKVVQERLGWASSAFMLQTYTHLVPGMQREAAERFADNILTDPTHPEEGSE